MKFTLRLSLLIAFLTLAGPSLLWAGEKGMLKIVTDPGEAKIYINGKRKGTSPAQAGQTFAIKLPEGEYILKAVKADGENYEYIGEKKDVFVAEDTLQTINIQLKRQLTPAGEAYQAQKEKERKARLARENSIKPAKLSIDPNNAGLVLDKQNGLMWMRCSLGQTWNGQTCTGTAKEYKWEQAKKQAKQSTLRATAIGGSPPVWNCIPSSIAPRADAAFNLTQKAKQQQSMAKIKMVAV